MTGTVLMHWAWTQALSISWILVAVSKQFGSTTLKLLVSKLLNFKLPKQLPILNHMG